MSPTPGRDREGWARCIMLAACCLSLERRVTFSSCPLIPEDGFYLRWGMFLAPGTSSGRRGRILCRFDHSQFHCNFIIINLTPSCLISRHAVHLRNNFHTVKTSKVTNPYALFQYTPSAYARRFLRVRDRFSPTGDVIP